MVRGCAVGERRRWGPDHRIAQLRAGASRSELKRKPDQLDQAFHALADSNRRAIVARLTRGAASVSELAAPLAVSLPTVLQHLDVLQRSGLVRSEKVGRVRTCRLEPGPIRVLENWIAEHRVVWERRLDLLSDVLDDAFPDHEGRSQQ